MNTSTPDESSNEISYYHSFVPHKYRVLTLIAFIQNHPKQKIIVACCSTGVVEFNTILFNINNLRCEGIHGKHDLQHRENSIRNFNDGTINVLFATSLLLSTVKITKPTWLVHYDIPKEIPDELNIIRNVNPEKFVLFIDQSQKKYLELLKEFKIVTKEMKFDEKKIPQYIDKIVKLTQDKNFKLYTSSQSGYRELIQTYVNHENNDIFNARELDLRNVSINFGIENPPKLQLSKNISPQK